MIHIPLSVQKVSRTNALYIWVKLFWKPIIVVLWMLNSLVSFQKVMNILLVSYLHLLQKNI